MKVCGNCKEPKQLDNFGNDKYQKDKHTSRCKECKKKYDYDYNRNSANKIKKRSKNYATSSYGRYIRLRAQVKGRKLELGITSEQYLNLMEERICYYCNGPLNSTGSGLDRIDSSKGYLIDNVVKCCKICNQMKNDLGQLEFFEHINSIYAKHIHGKAEFYE